MTELKPTKHASVQDKERFIRQFKHFVESDFNELTFPKWFYVRLSMTFGHIAHYNREGFYDTFFKTTCDKITFLEQCRDYGCFGQPEYTFCDAEAIIAAWIREKKIVQKYEKKAKAEQEEMERKLLKQLKEKYEEK